MVNTKVREFLSIKGLNIRYKLKYKGYVYLFFLEDFRISRGFANFIDIFLVCFEEIICLLICLILFS